MSSCCGQASIVKESGVLTGGPGAGDPPSDAQIIDQVKEVYGAKAQEGVSVDYARSVAAAFGYTEEELKAVPDASHLGLSCGHPTATAKLREGENVVDLGSGGGIDVFLAAAKVGPKGQVVGLDTSEDMISLARKNAASRGLKPPHVSFVLASLTDKSPVESNSVDCVITNCVINLLPPAGKTNALKEAHRILKGGGRIMLDDIIAKKPLPEDIKNDASWYTGCIGGAITLEEYERLLLEAGFSQTLFVDTKSDLSVYYKKPSSASCCTPSKTPIDGLIEPKLAYDINEWAGSFQIYAVKDSSPRTVAVTQNVLSEWWSAYPAVKSSPQPIESEEVMKLIRNVGADTEEFAVIDVRRNDHTGGHVRVSHNWHAQSFYDDLPAFFEKFSNTKKVIFYCNRSTGRGPRSAGWYQDYLDAHPEEHQSAAYVMKGGIKEWLEKYGTENDLVDHD